MQGEGESTTYHPWPRRSARFSSLIVLVSTTCSQIGSLRIDLNGPGNFGISEMGRPGWLMQPNSLVWSSCGPNSPKRKSFRGGDGGGSRSKRVGVDSGVEGAVDVDSEFPIRAGILFIFSPLCPRQER